MNRNIPKIAAILSLSVSITLFGQPVLAKTSFTPLKQGMKHARVAEVEKMLNALDFDQNLKVDKVYNKYTASNVKKFQKKYKLKQTGIVDKKTYDKLKQVYGQKMKKKPSTPAKPDSTPTPVKPTKQPADQSATLKLGSSGEKVRNLQEMLKYLEFPININGKYDEATQFAVMLFQNRYKTGPSTGVADPKTYQAIVDAYEAAKKKTQPQPAPNPQPAPQPKPQPQPAPNPQPQPAPVPADLTAEEKQMVQLVNQERQKQGLPALQVDMKLQGVARAKAQDMVTNGYFSHTSPTYGSPFEMMRAFGVSYRTAAENIGQHWSVTGAHQMFMNSAGHRANIMNASYTHVAIGIVQGGPSGKVFVQMFIQK